mgnify:CR=1 FL=1
MPNADRVLAAMKRGYTALEYRSIVRRLRTEVVPAADARAEVGALGEQVAVEHLEGEPEEVHSLLVGKRAHRFGAIDDKVHDELLQLAGIRLNGWYVIA